MSCSGRFRRTLDRFPADQYGSRVDSFPNSPFTLCARPRGERPMKTVGVAAALAIALVVAGSALAAGGTKTMVKADPLTGYQEATPAGVSTGASGSFEATIDEDASTIDFTLSYSGLEAPVLFAHIHFGNRFTSGGVSAFLCGGGSKPPCPQQGTVTGTVTAADVIGPTAQGIEAGAFAELVRAMRAGVTYTNVHSTKFPAGEIRGQINDTNQRQP